MRRMLRTLIAAALLLLLQQGTVYAGSVTALSSGSWNNGATWSGGSVPNNGDDVTIGTGLSVSLSANSLCKSLTVNGTLDGGSYQLSVNTGAVTVNGTLKCGHTSGLFDGTFAGTPALTLGVASTVEFYGSTYQVINVRDYANLVISGNRGGAYLNIAAGTINIAGTFTHSATNANYNNDNTVIRYQGIGQAIAVFPYFGLDLTGATGVQFPSGTVKIRGAFTPGSTTAAPQGTINFCGNGQTVPAFSFTSLDLSNANSVQFSTTGTIAISGSFVPGWTSSATAGSTIRFNGSNQAVPAFGYYHLDLTGATGTTFATTNYPGIDISGTFTPGNITTATSGSYFNFKGSNQVVPAFNYHNLSLAGASGTTFSPGTVGIAGAFNSGSIAGTSQGTIRFTGSGQSLTSNFNFFNLDLTGASNISFTNYTLGIGGTFTPGAVSSAGTNYTINFTGSGQTVPAFSYYNLSLAGATAPGFADGIISIGNSFNAGSVTNITQGTIRFTGSSPSIPAITYWGLDISSPGNVYLAGGQTWTINGPFTTGTGTTINLSPWAPTTFNIAGSLNYGAAGGQSLQYLTLNLTNSGTMSGLGSGTMPNITIASDATRTLTGNFNITSGSTLTVNGTLNAAGFALGGGGATTVNSAARVYVGNANGLRGAFANSGAISLAAGAHYIFNGNTAQSTGFAGMTMGLPASVTVSNSDADVTLDTDLTLANSAAFSVSANARFDAGTRAIAFGSGGTVSISGTFRTANTAGLSGGAATTFRNTNTPTITLAAGSTIDYTASAAQVVTARADYHHLALSNGSKSLEANTSIAGNLSLSGNAKLPLGSRNLSIGGTMSGDASNFVVTDGAGSVVLRSVGSSGKTFVIGASAASYSPLTVKEGSSLDWTVNVQPGNTPSIITQQDNIQRTWTITPSINPTPLPGTLTFQYNEGDAAIQGSNWNSSGYVSLKRHNGNDWTLFGTVAPTGTPGGIRTATIGGVQQFSPWIVAKGGAVLPVRMLRFSGRREGGSSKLQWTTASETGNHGFVVERSANGRSFEAVGTVASRALGGNSSTELSYDFSEVAAGPRHYYRIRQQDYSGAVHYSNVILLQDDHEGPALSGLYPNPAGGTLQASFKSDVAGRGELRVVNAAGQTVLRREQYFAAGANAVSVDVSQLPAGTWYLQVQTAGRSAIAAFSKK